MMSVHIPEEEAQDTVGVADRLSMRNPLIRSADGLRMRIEGQLGGYFGIDEDPSTGCTVISADAVLLAGHSSQVWPIKISINREQARNLAKRLSDKVLARVPDEQKS